VIVAAIAAMLAKRRSSLRAETLVSGASLDECDLASAVWAVERNWVADEDRGTCARLEHRSPNHVATGRIAQSLDRLPGEPIAHAHSLACHLPRRQHSILRFNQFDPGGDIHTIRPSLCGDPHCHATRLPANV